MSYVMTWPASQLIFALDALTVCCNSYVGHQSPGEHLVYSYISYMGCELLSYAMTWLASQLIFALSALNICLDFRHVA